MARDLVLYQYAVILQPRVDKDGDITEEGAIVVDLTTVLAENEDQATLLASRAIPADFLDRLNRLTVAVRPF